MLGVLGDRVSPQVTAAVVLAIQAISLVVLLTLPVGFGVWAFIALFGAARGVAGLVRPSVVASLYGRERFASISGAMSTFVMGSTATRDRCRRRPRSVGELHPAVLGLRAA